MDSVLERDFKTKAALGYSVIEEPRLKKWIARQSSIKACECAASDTLSALSPERAATDPLCCDCEGVFLSAATVQRPIALAATVQLRFS